MATLRYWKVCRTFHNIACKRINKEDNNSCNFYLILFEYTGL